jgi:hypothetical protein
MLHTDIPDRSQVGRLLEHRGAHSVSIYVATDPVSRGDAERIEFKNLANEAVVQLREADAGSRELAPLEEQASDLVDDDEFWLYRARSLATFATPASPASTGRSTAIPASSGRPSAATRRRPPTPTWRRAPAPSWTRSPAGCG